MRVVVVGAGTGGCAFAGRVAQDGRHEVVLVEAGTDFGPFDAQGWPFELLDSRRLPSGHDWALANADPGAGRTYALSRARVVGGCSSHNGCAAVRGVRADFERWCEAGGSRFWDPDALLEDFAAIEAALRVRTYAPCEITPFQQDFHDAARAAGVPPSADINDIDEGVGASIAPVNKRGGTRWNAAFAFIDPVRDRAGLTIVDRFEAETLVLDGTRVRGVQGTLAGRPMRVEGDLVVLAAGAYGTPMLLLRSGIGDPAALAAAGIAAHHALPGVGRNLQDHPAIVLDYRAEPGLIHRFETHERQRLAYDEGTILKLRSPFTADPFDMHVFAAGGRTADLAGWYWQLYVALLTPRSRGRIRPQREGGTLGFTIEHGHVTDAQGHDLRALSWGLTEARRIAAFEPFASGLVEVAPGQRATGDGIAAWIRAEHQHYYHPASSCSIGRDPEAGAVVDAQGRAHGLEGLMIADASIMPTVTTANTNLPVAALAHRLARHLDAILAGTVG